MRYFVPPCAAVALLFAGCAGHLPEVKHYVGGVPETGRGGTVKVIDGVQFWDNGSPARKFVQVGLIDEDFVWDPTPKEFKLWAQAAAAAGGDAVIFPPKDSRDLPVAKVVKIL